MKSLVKLLGHMLLDGGMRCTVDPTLDIRTIERRCEHEGLGFLTMTLPDMCSAIDRALACGRLATTLAFKSKGGLPRFLGGFLRLVFDDKGSLRKDASIDAIIVLRQVLNLVKKVRLECSDERKRRAMDAYIACEDAVSQVQTDTEEYQLTVKVGRIIFSEILRDVPFGDVLPFIRGRHGPGATSERILGNRKYVHQTWFSRLDDAGLSFEEYGLASLSNLGGDDTPDPTRLGSDEETPVRVIFVPKTAKAPRVIAIEPVCMQFMQQAVLNWLAPRVERCALTKGHVNFTDQSFNRTACKEASIHGNRSTIDLSEASDRVPWALVRDMLRPFPAFAGVVAACRSTRAKLPDGRIVHLGKFASMGSALCFPVEAIVFFSAIVAARIREAASLTGSSPTGSRPRGVTPEARHSPRTGHIREYSRGVLVYGDDIVIPSDATVAVTEFFHKLGFVVNSRKSFSDGYFRESCGEDYYRGERVTPIYVRELLSGDRSNASGLISTVSLANQLYLAGYWGAARYVRNIVEQKLGKLPHISRDSAGLGWWSFSNRTTIQRWNTNLHRFEYRGWSVDQRYEQGSLTGDPALFKALSGLPRGSVLPVFAESKDKKHLERYSTPGAVALKRRWLAY